MCRTGFVPAETAVPCAAPLRPALRTLLPRRRGAARRTRCPVDHVTVYRWVQRVYITAGRRRPSPPPHTGRSVVRRRDIRQGQRDLALRLPGARPARPGHRRAAGDPPRRSGGSSVLHPRIADAEGDAERGGHRRWSTPPCAGRGLCHGPPPPVVFRAPRALHDTRYQQRKGLSFCYRCPRIGRSRRLSWRRPAVM